MLYESLVHPLTILTGLPSAALGALATLTLFGMDLSVIAMIGPLSFGTRALAGIAIAAAGGIALYILYNSSARNEP